MSKKATRLKKAMNIGTSIEQYLNGIGIYSLRELAILGPAKAYQKICRKHPGKTFPVCYYLYSLQGALMNVHWNKLPLRLKKELLKQAGK